MLHNKKNNKSRQITHCLRDQFNAANVPHALVNPIAPRQNIRGGCRKQVQLLPSTSYTKTKATTRTTQLRAVLLIKQRTGENTRSAAGGGRHEPTLAT